MFKRIITAAVLSGLGATMAMAEVTGDFKVTGSGFVNDVAAVSGTVNHGAIQSGKTVVVDVRYDYSFVAEKTEIIPGESSTVSVFVPGKCVTGVPNQEGCFDRYGNPQAVNGAIWTGTYETSTVVTEPRIAICEIVLFDGARSIFTFGAIEPSESIELMSRDFR